MAARGAGTFHTIFFGFGAFGSFLDFGCFFGSSVADILSYLLQDDGINFS
jgi:hypothetical protein